MVITVRVFDMDDDCIVFENNYMNFVEDGAIFIRNEKFSGKNLGDLS